MSDYAVIMQYRSDGLLEENQVEFFRSLDDAVAYVDSQHDEMLKVFRVEPVSESALWDWGIREAGTDDQPNFAYTSESAARRSCPKSHEVIRRRKGVKVWQVADQEAVNSRG